MLFNAVNENGTCGSQFCALQVMTPLIIADVTKGTGRFNVAQGVFGTIMGIGAVVSPTLTGLIVDRFGYSAGFVSLAVAGLLALLVLAIFMPETKEDRLT
jgi:MFS family permease